MSALPSGPLDPFSAEQKGEEGRQRERERGTERGVKRHRMWKRK